MVDEWQHINTSHGLNAVLTKAASSWCRLMVKSSLGARHIFLLFSIMTNCCKILSISLIGFVGCDCLLFVCTSYIIDPEWEVLWTSNLSMFTFPMVISLQNWHWAWWRNICIIWQCILKSTWSWTMQTLLLICIYTLIYKLFHSTTFCTILVFMPHLLLGSLVLVIESSFAHSLFSHITTDLAILKFFVCLFSTLVEPTMHFLDSNVGSSSNDLWSFSALLCRFR